jgi:hypothetical protein
MKHRKLRIAWSVGWGLLAVLLCVLWVRSFWKLDNVSSGLTGIGGTASSYNGSLKLFVNKSLALPKWPRWRWTSYSGEQSLSRIHAHQGNPSQFDFQFAKSSGVFAIQLPHWLPFLLCACTAAAPFARFSLRTLLIATTLFAVVLGLIVYAG